LSSTFRLPRRRSTTLRPLLPLRFLQLPIRSRTFSSLRATRTTTSSIDTTLCNLYHTFHTYISIQTKWYANSSSSHIPSLIQWGVCANTTTKQAQTLEQRRRNAKFVKDQDARRGKAEQDIKKRHKEPMKSPISPFWLGESLPSFPD
jgi:hypothetical protein